MNLHRLKKRLRRLYRKLRYSFKRFKRKLGNYNSNGVYDGSGHRKIRDIRYYREIIDSNKLWYAAYIIAMSVLCILLAGTLPGINFKKWRRERSNVPTINKGIALEMDAKDIFGNIPSLK